jgi:hypothetical protein
MTIEDDTLTQSHLRSCPDKMEPTAIETQSAVHGLTDQNATSARTVD